MKITVILSVIFALILNVNGGIQDNCMKCICQVKGCERNVGSCYHNGGYPACGPYRITQPYWIDCGSLGASWEACTQTMECSEDCVKAYMERYGSHCTGGREPTCEDYAKIHNEGPTGCTHTSNEFWNKVNTCVQARE